MRSEQSPVTSDTDLDSSDGSKTARPTTSQVYEELRGMILDHTIPPATKVNIHHISQKFGVSPTPVREALRLLQGDNLLVATSNKGYATTDILDRKGVLDLFEFRLLIEPWATGAAASNRLSNPAAELRRELDDFQAAPEKIQESLIAHDNRFHTAILIAAGNNVVLKAFEQSHCHLHLFRMYTDNWDWQATITEHEAIAQAVNQADPEAAEAAMKEHLHGAFQRFAEAMGENSQQMRLRATDAGTIMRSAQVG